MDRRERRKKARKRQAKAAKIREMMKESQPALLVFDRFGKRKRVFFIESILPQSFIGQLGFLFDIFMRAYAKISLFLIIVCFIINEFISKVLVFNFILYYCYFLFAIVIISYYFHCRLRDYIGDDVNKWIAINMTNCVDRRVDAISLITLHNLRIPPEFNTEHPLADQFLEGVQKTPFMHNLAWTTMDYKYFRFSWIKVDKSNPTYFINSLEPADTILYHSKKSTIGWFIRLVTRCYWNHSAIYMGDGKVLDIAPGGVKLIDIMAWLEDESVELSVLRKPFNSEEEQAGRDVMLERAKKFVGHGYGYFSLLKDFYHLLTNKKGDGFMKLHIFLINILLLLIILFTYLRRPDLTRLHLFLIMIFTPYVIDTIYHWWAYKKQFDKLSNLKLFERLK